MSRLQGAGDLEADGARFCDRHGLAAPDHLFEVAPSDVLHHDVVDAAVFADIIDVADVGVREACGRARFQAEASEKLAVGGKLLPEELDGHDPPEQAVERPVDDGHASLADPFDQLVPVGQGLAGQRIAQNDRRLPTSQSYKSNASTAAKNRRAIGAATWLAHPPFFTTMATATLGSWAG